MLIAFNKPFGVICQFSSDGSANVTLSAFGFPPNVYSLGRLDADSEGLLLLSDEPALNSTLLHPSNAHQRQYLVQVEGIPSDESIRRLGAGVQIGDYTTKKCRVRRPDPQPIVAARNPPIRVRKSIPDCWLEITLIEGKNRQVRRMTAAVGHPTLRLIRMSIGELALGDLSPGSWRELSTAERQLVFF